MSWTASATESHIILSDGSGLISIDVLDAGDGERLKAYADEFVTILNRRVTKIHVDTVSVDDAIAVETPVVETPIVETPVVETPVVETSSEAVPEVQTQTTE